MMDHKEFKSIQDKPTRREQMIGAVNTGAATSTRRSTRVKTRPRILVVDDDYFFVDLAENTLSEDFDVIYASNGAMALEIASQRHPDVILLDVMMPEIHGYEVCRRLKAHHETRSIPVIFLTSLGEASSQEIGLRLGAADYITKPFDPAALKIQINKQIGLKCSMSRQRRWRRTGARVLEFMTFWRHDLLP